MFSNKIFALSSAVAALLVSLVQAQNCLTSGTCGPDPGFTSTDAHFTDFTQATSLPPGWILADYETVTYGPNGAEFTFAKRHDAPTMWTDSYIFFGRVDTVMQAAPGVGIISSSVLLSDDADEIDWEFSGNNFASGRDSVQTNYFCQRLGGAEGGSAPSVASPQTQFHTYSVEYTSTGVTWWIDGTVVRVLGDGHRLPQTPMRVYLGLWDAGDPDGAPGTVAWSGGTTDLNGGPYTMYVKSVNIVNYNPACQYNYTDATGNWQSIDKMQTCTSSTTSLPPTSTSSSTASTCTSYVPAPTQTVSGTTSNCCKWHTQQSGDTCSSIESTYGITFGQFQFWNPSINTDCYNLYLGYAYCVSSSDTPANSTSSTTAPTATSTATSTSSTTTTTVSSQTSVTASTAALPSVYSHPGPVPSSSSTSIPVSYVSTSQTVMSTTKESFTNTISTVGASSATSTESVASSSTATTSSLLTSPAALTSSPIGTSSAGNSTASSSNSTSPATAATATTSLGPSGLTTYTVQITETSTILTCAPSVADCPAKSATSTSVITTVYPSTVVGSATTGPSITTSAASLSETTVTSSSVVVLTQSNALGSPTATYTTTEATTRTSTVQVVDTAAASGIISPAYPTTPSPSASSFVGSSPSAGQFTAATTSSSVNYSVESAAVSSPGNATGVASSQLPSAATSTSPVGFTGAASNIAPAGLGFLLASVIGVLNGQA